MTTVGHIYAILDPRKPFGNNILDVAFYIGITTKPLVERLSQHVSDSKGFRNKNLYKENKIRKILQEGLYPGIVSLQQSEGVSLKELEKFYIKFFRTLGVDLTNATEGGEFNPMVDLPYDQVTDSIERARISRQKIYDKRLEEKCIELGISVEEYSKWKSEQNKIYAQQWRANKTPEDKKENAEQTQKRRMELREEMGDEAYRKLVAEEKRTWYSNLSEEQKIEQRKKDSDNRKVARANETPEEKLERRSKVTKKRREAKQKLIEEIGIEEYKQRERDRRKNWNPHKKPSEEQRQKRKDKHKEYMENETPEQREDRLSRNRKAKIKMRLKKKLAKAT